MCVAVSQSAPRLAALQEHIKQQIMIKPGTHYRGYQQLGANVTRYDEGYQRDWHEAIDLYREKSPQVAMPHLAHAKHSACKDSACMQKTPSADNNANSKACIGQCILLPCSAEPIYSAAALS